MIDWRFWLTLPGLLPQALRLRSTALRMAPAAGPSEGLIGDGSAPIRLLLLGDSIIAGIGVDRLERAFPGQLARALAGQSGRAVAWQALGQGGWNAARIVAELLPRLTDQVRFDLAVFSVGVNDVTGLTSRWRWRAQLAQLHDRLSEFANLSVHLGLPPLDRFPALPPALRRSFGHRARQLDGIAGEVADAGSARLHLPMQVMPNDDQFAPDGFHPNAEACALWAIDVAQRIGQYERRPLHG